MNTKTINLQTSTTTHCMLIFSAHFLFSLVGTNDNGFGVI